MFAVLKSSSKKLSFLLGLTFGLFHFITMLYWIAFVIYEFGNLSLFSSIGVLLLLCLYLSTYYALACVISKHFSLFKEPNFFKALCFSLVFTGALFLKSHLFEGFPWESPGYTLSNYPTLLQVSDIFGIQGLNFLFFFTNYFVFLIAYSIFKKKSIKLSSLVYFVALFLLVFVYGKVRLNEFKVLRTKNEVKVAIIQPSIPQKVKLAQDFDYMFNEYLKLLKKVNENFSGVIIFPETAFPYFYGQNPELDAEVKTMLSPFKNAVFLLGTFRFVNGKLYNSVIAVKNGKVIDYYDKEKLVPFGEYLPYPSVLFFLKNILPQEIYFSSGNSKLLIFEVNNKKVLVLPLICFESAFSSLVRERLVFNPSFVVVFTNDAWFDDTSCPYQHFQMAIVRAVESRRFVVQVANTGISGIIAPSGRVITKLGVNQKGVLIKKVSLLSGTTPAVTFGSVFGITGALVFLVLLLPALRK